MNIHGHDHSNKEDYQVNCKHINLAGNVCGYTPMNLGEAIKNGLVSDVDNIHRKNIDRATSLKESLNLPELKLTEESHVLL